MSAPYHTSITAKEAIRVLSRHGCSIINAKRHRTVQLPNSEILTFSYGKNNDVLYKADLSRIEKAFEMSFGELKAAPKASLGERLSRRAVSLPALSQHTENGTGAAELGLEEHSLPILQVPQEQEGSKPDGSKSNMLWDFFDDVLELRFTAASVPALEAEVLSLSSQLQSRNADLASLRQLNAKLLEQKEQAQKSFTEKPKKSVIQKTGERLYSARHTRSTTPMTRELLVWGVQKYKASGGARSLQLSTKDARNLRKVRAFFYPRGIKNKELLSTTLEDLLRLTGF